MKQLYWGCGRAWKCGLRAYRCAQEAFLEERWSLGGEGKGFSPLAGAALSHLAQNSEGSENSNCTWPSRLL